MNTYIFGVPVVFFGFGLMFWHWRQWNLRQMTMNDTRELAYYGGQFKRRAIVGSLIAVVGSVITSFRWVNDPIVFSVSVLVLLLLLTAIVFLAIADLFYGVLHFKHGPEADAARRAMIDEYLRLRERNATQAKEKMDDEQQ